MARTIEHSRRHGPFDLRGRSSLLRRSAKASTGKPDRAPEDGVPGWEDEGGAVRADPVVQSDEGGTR